MKKVLVGGCFDLLHFGHIEFLRKAKSHGDRLVVALEADANVRRRKGDSRPIHTQAQRRAMLEALSFVDEVLPLPVMAAHEDYYELVRRLKPNVIVVTEGDKYLDKKKEQAAMVDAKVVIIPKIPTPSTSQLATLLGLE